MTSGLTLDAADLWGRIYLDHWRGESHPHELIRDDGKSHTIASAADYFVATRSAGEQEALATLSGRVLDLGCGAGSYTRFLEDRGVSVTAIDASPGAIAVCRERGCRDARVADMDSPPADAGLFDAMICMGNTLGIGATPATLSRRLSTLRALTDRKGRILAVLRDPLSTRDPDHLRYHERNRAAGRPVGLTRTRLRYRGDLGDWWELWMPTEPELQLAARDAGWDVHRLSSYGGTRLYEFTPADEAHT
jgi:SAM-dependent methyltransferase